MKKRISIYICVMMLAFSFAGCTSEQSEKKPEIELQQIKSIGEFAVLECYYHNVEKSAKAKGTGLAHVGEKEKNSGSNTPELLRLKSTCRM